jgi:hypothetical protein
MTKPSETLDWGGTQVMPSGGARSAGFAPGDRPGAQALNALLGNIDEWVKYLDEQNELFFEKLRDMVEASSSIPVLSVASTAHDHPSSSSNIWKEALKFAVADGTFMRLLAGDGPSGMWAITVNARWNAASGAQNWSHDDPTKPAMLTVTGGDGSLSTAIAPATGGPSTWTDWGNTGVMGASEFVYAVPITRIVALQHYEATPLTTFGAANGWYTDSARITATLASDKCRIPIRLPHGATLDSVEVIVDQATSTGISFDVLRNSAPNYSSPAAGSQSTLKTATANSSTGVKKVSLTAIAHTVNNADEFYLFATAGGVGDKILGARVTFTDPGPRNY